MAHIADQEGIRLTLLQERWLRRGERASRALEGPVGDSGRLARHLQDLRAVQEELRLAIPYYGEDWVQQRQDECAEVIAELEEAWQASNNLEVSGYIRPAYYISTNGRPALHIDPEWLSNQVNAFRLGPSEIAQSLRPLQVSARTVRRRIISLNIRQTWQPTIEYDSPTEEQLDALVAECLRLNPAAGVETVQSFVDGTYFVSRRQIRRTLRRLRPIHHFMRSDNTIRRRTYSVPGPNSLWHNDGCHHLIGYGIVIHAFIDGYSRLLLAIRASSNNTGETVLELFRSAVQIYGWPIRGRGDRGGENIEVAIELTMHHNQITAYIFGT